MHNEDNKEKTPKKQFGPGPRMGSGEKAKDFKSAIKRLFKELNDYKILITISLVLAALGAILSILAPNKLSKLTDEIQKGLVVNKSNIELLTNEIKENISEEKIKEVIPQVLQMNLSQENIYKILSSNEIKEEDKREFQEFLSNINNPENSKNILTELSKLPESILKEVISESYYNETKITYNDKKMLLDLLNSKGKNIKIPKSMKDIFFSEITIDNTKISASDQYEFATALSEMKDTSSATELYKKIDGMPESIQSVIKPFMDIDKIKSIALVLLVMYLCSALFTYIQSICMTNVSNKFAKKLRTSISKKINRLPLKYFDGHQTGDILSRVTNDVDTIAQSMNQSLASLVSSITLFLGTIIMMFYTNWILAITAILSSLIGFAGMSLILKNSQKYFIARQEELGKLNGHIEEIYSGLNVVKAYNGKKSADEKFDLYNNGVWESNMKSQFLSGLMQPMMSFIGNFGYVAVCIVGALLTVKGNISFGVIVAFITYVRLFTSPLAQMAQAMTSLQSTAAASERVFEFVDEKEMPNQRDMTEKLDKSTVKGNIEFENVMFQYEDADKPTIKNFTAKAKQGQKIAIVGPTGAGKTTMVNLLMKFYEINSGDIKIDGISTKKLTRENIHELFTMVLQDTWLFDGTVKENIIYNRKNITDEQVQKVCKEVGLDHFIKTLPHGYNSSLSENDSVSAGQRQLLTIARGMIENAPFLILDEATSNVDTRTEELVQKAMDKLTEGKTSFIIAHRLSTIKNADLILVMKDGNIIEQGNHEELMKKKGFYAELYNSQFEL